MPASLADAYKSNELGFCSSMPTPIEESHSRQNTRVTLNFS
jgi:hypothetical protein